MIIVDSPRTEEQRERRFHRVAVGVIPMDCTYLQRRAAPVAGTHAGKSTCTVRVNTPTGAVAVAVGIHCWHSPPFCRHVERRDHDHVSHQCSTMLQQELSGAVDHSVRTPLHVEVTK